MNALIRVFTVVLFLLGLGVAFDLLFGVKQTKETLYLAIALIALMRSYEASDASK